MKSESAARLSPASLEPELEEALTPSMASTWAALTVIAIYAFRWMAKQRERELIGEVEICRDQLRPHQEEAERLRSRCADLEQGARAAGEALARTSEERDAFRKQVEELKPQVPPPAPPRAVPPPDGDPPPPGTPAA